tara:strand:- start:811 stop:1038 length:228 start_codon:yes stop_codon:yes gene_type:complete
MNSEEYNGWTSFETWQANLWLDEYGGVEQIDLHEDFLYDLLFFMAGEPTSGLAGDIFNSWISCVNFNEIIGTRED